MDTFNVVDGIVAVIILMSAILAYSRGFVRETMAIAGWVVAAIVAYVFAPQAVPLVREIPVLKDFIADSCELSVIAAFAGVFAVALVVVSLFAPLFAGVVRHSAFSAIDQGLGFLFGVVRGVLLVAIALFIYDRLATTDSLPMIDDSRTAKVFARIQDRIAEAMPQDGPQWVIDRYKGLVSVCATPKTGGS